MLKQLVFDFTWIQTYHKKGDNIKSMEILAEDWKQSLISYGTVLNRSPISPVE